MKKKRLLVLANDTNSGKTWVSCEILKRAHGDGFRLLPFKPFAAGDRGDAIRLSAAANSTVGITQVNPVFFQPPLAPYAASMIEEKSLPWDLVEKQLSELENAADALLIESAGGIFSPLDRVTDMMDLAQRWTADVILIVPNRLGTITQCRCVLENLISRKITPLAVVLNDKPQPNFDANQNSPEILEMTKSTNTAILSEHYPQIPFYDSRQTSLDELWAKLKVRLTISY